MPLIEWNSSFSVQNNEMDRQHQQLFSLLNKLHEALAQGKGKETLPILFNDLLRYTQSHFAAEETLLQRHNYPGLATQKREHADLTAQAVKLQKQFQAGDFSAGMQTSIFLKKWLTEHIQGTDQKYGEHLKNSGVN
jgi:hemerythrin